MTKEEAISLLNKITSYCYFVDGYGDMTDSEPYYEAIDLAIKALEATDSSRFTMAESEDCTSEEEVTDIILSIAQNLERICEVIRNDVKRADNETSNLQDV